MFLTDINGRHEVNFFVTLWFLSLAIAVSSLRTQRSVATMASSRRIVSILATGAKTSSKSIPCSCVGGVIGPHKSPYTKPSGEKAIRNVENDKHEAVKTGNDGGSPSKVSFEAYVSNTWRKFGFKRITRNDDGVYLFKFTTKSGEVTKVPVWVNMYNVPILAYSEDGLSLLGTLIDAAVGLKKAVIMAIPEEEGDGYIKEVVNVEYEWKPPHCVECQSFGHDTSLCPKRVREEVPKNSARETKTTVMEENNDGFTEVKSHRKNKGANFWGISPPELNKWDVINEDDTADDEDVFTSYGASVGGGNQLEDEDCDFYEGYADQVVDLDGALKEFRDFKLSMSSRK
nr:hypothetical protein [Tanacetum cinerariifolium]